MKTKQLDISENKVLIGDSNSRGAESAYEFPSALGSGNQVLASDGSGALTFVDQAGASKRMKQIYNTNSYTAGAAGEPALDGLTVYQWANNTNTFTLTLPRLTTTLLPDNMGGGTGDGSIIEMWFGRARSGTLTLVCDTNDTIEDASGSHLGQTTTSLEVTAGTFIKIVGYNFNNSLFKWVVEHPNSLESLVAQETNASISFQPNGTGAVVVKGDTYSGELRINDLDDTNYIAIKSPNTVASNYALTLPAATGTANQVLETNGSGVLAWVDQSGGGNPTIAYTTSSSSITAQVGYHHIFDHLATAQTVTMPASPSDGDLVFLTRLAEGPITLTGNTSQKVRRASSNDTSSTTSVTFDPVGDTIRCTYVTSQATWVVENQGSLEKEYVTNTTTVSVALSAVAWNQRITFTGNTNNDITVKMPPTLVLYAGWTFTLGRLIQGRFILEDHALANLDFKVIGDGTTYTNTVTVHPGKAYIRVTYDGTDFIVSDLPDAPVEVTPLSATAPLSTPPVNATREIYTATGTITVTLPAATTLPSGFQYDIKNIGTGTVTINGGGTNIDAAATFDIATQYNSITIVSNGTQYFII